MRPEIAALAAQLAPRMIPAHAFRAARFYDGRISTECYELLPDPSTQGGRAFCLLPVGEHVFDGMLWAPPNHIVWQQLAHDMLEVHRSKAVSGGSRICAGCSGYHSDQWVAWPCDAAKLALRVHAAVLTERV